MNKTICLLLVGLIFALAAAPALGGTVTPTALSEEETAALAIEEGQAIDTAGPIAAGMADDTKNILAAVGIVFIVLVVVAAIA